MHALVVFDYIQFSKFHTHNRDDTIPRYTSLFAIYQNGCTAVPSLFLQSSSCRNLSIYYLLLLLSWSTSYTLSQFLDLEHNLHFHFTSGKTYTYIKMLSFYFKICSDNYVPYAYWTVHHLDIWIKVDQLDDTCFIMSIYCSTCFGC